MILEPELEDAVIYVTMCSALHLLMKTLRLA